MWHSGCNKPNESASGSDPTVIIVIVAAVVVVCFALSFGIYRYRKRTASNHASSLEYEGLNSHYKPPTQTAV
jgi:hypothetical protein